MLLDSNNRKVKRPTFALRAIFAAALLGCSQGGSSAPKKAAVDAGAVAAKALSLCDANQDGSIDADEAAAKCPPLAAALSAYDADADGKLTEKEVADRITGLARATTAMTSIGCTVYFNGRPLAGALVKLRPAEIFGDALLPAEGTTDELGVARPTVGDAHLPDKLAGMPMLYPGLYHVEITHPQTKLPEQYNTATQLGCEVDPLSRSGIAARFDLKPN